MEWEFAEDADGGGSFVATGKVVNFLRTHLARGEMDEALALYESCAQDVGDQLTAEFVTSSTKLQKAMANLFFRARDYKRAATACEKLGEWPAAARSYEAAFAYEQAAACYVRANQHDKAAAVYRKAGNCQEAARLYRSSGNLQGAAEATAKDGDPLGAARLLIEAGELTNAARSLAQIGPGHPGHAEAVITLADVLLKLGRPDVAMQRLRGALPEDGIVRTAEQAGIAYELGRLLENQGQADNARLVFTVIREFDPGFRDVAQRFGVVGAPIVGQPDLLGDARGGVMPVAADPFAALDVRNDRRRVTRGASLADIDVVGMKAASGFVTRMEDYELLKTLPIFETLSLDEMKDFYHLCEQQQYSAGEVLIEQGRSGQGVFIIREGTVEVARVDNAGKETPVAQLSAGKYVGEMSLIDDAQTSARVTARTEVRAFHIGKQAFQDYLFTHDLVALRIYRTFTQTLAQRLRETMDKMSDS